MMPMVRWPGLRFAAASGLRATTRRMPARVRPLRPALPGPNPTITRRLSSNVTSDIEEEVLWPIGAAAILVTGVLLGATALSSDRPVRRLHSWVEQMRRSGMTSETVTVPWLIRFATAFGLTQIPAESLRQRQLGMGALRAWGGLLGSFNADYEQQAIALGALCALLESDGTAHAFRQETGCYDTIVDALPALVRESSQALRVPEILTDTLNLGCVTASHPSAHARAPSARGAPKASACRLHAASRLPC